MSDMNAEKYLIHILKCVLNGQKPDEKPDNIDFEKVFTLAKYHKVDAMAFYGIDMLENKPDEAIYKKWKDEKNLAIYRNALQAIAFDEIVNKFSDANIEMIPLKGFRLKELYPTPDCRWMNDIDILVHKEDFEKAESIMLALGYEVLLALQKDTEYIKKPGIQAEIHTELFEKRREHYEHFTDVWKHVVCDEDMLYYMPIEYEYIYLLVHAQKHFNESGTGIRTVLDLYLYCRHYEQSWNSEYINKHIELLGLAEFENKMAILAENWFGANCSNDYKKDALTNNDEFADYIISSGVFGNRQNYFKNEMKRLENKGELEGSGKLKYVFNKAFLPYKRMVPLYPVLKKIPILLPLCWIDKDIKIIFKKREKIKWLFNTMKSKENK